MLSKLHNILSLLLLAVLLLLLPYSIQAQGESTQEPTPVVTEAPIEVTEQAPVTVIIEAPPNTTETGDVSQGQLLISAFLVLSLLFNAVQAFWGKGSIPPDIANQIFAGLRVLSKTTKTEDDDKLIDAGEAAYNALMPKAPPEEKPRD